MPIGPKQSSKLPSLFVQHAQVQVNKLQVTGGSRVISSSQLSVKSLGHGTNACVDLHTHLSHSVLQRRHQDLLKVERGSIFTFTRDLPYIASILCTRAKLTYMGTYKLRDSGNPPLVRARLTLFRNRNAQKCCYKSPFTRCLGPLKSCIHNNTVVELDLEGLRCDDSELPKQVICRAHWISFYSGQTNAP